MNTVEEDEPIWLKQMNRKPKLRVEHTTPLRSVVPGSLRTWFGLTTKGR